VPKVTVEKSDTADTLNSQDECIYKAKGRLASINFICEFEVRTHPLLNSRKLFFYIYFQYVTVCFLIC